MNYTTYRKAENFAPLPPCPVTNTVVLGAMLNAHATQKIRSGVFQTQQLKHISNLQQYGLKAMIIKEVFPQLIYIMMTYHEHVKFDQQQMRVKW